MREEKNTTRECTRYTRRVASLKLRHVCGSGARRPKIQSNILLTRLFRLVFLAHCGATTATVFFRCRDSFRKVFSIFEANANTANANANAKANSNANANANANNITIVETGTTSATTNWPYSGQSTLLFDRFLNFGTNDGRLFSVDLDARSCLAAAGLTSVKADVHHGDSVSRLLSLGSALLEEGAMVDLIYLDSWDVSGENWREGDDHEPSLHALKELAAIFGRLRRPGGMVLVDDNMVEGYTDPDAIREKFKEGVWNNSTEYNREAKIRGKGRYVNDFLERDNNCQKIFHGWQLLWVC